MPRLLVAYDTAEGQTRRVAERAADIARQAGHEVELRECRRARPEPTPDAVLLAAAIHAGKHGRAAGRFVAERAELLARVPSAFLSVSLSAADDAHRAEAEGYVAAFLAATGWRPTVQATVAGALAYTRYGFLKRWMMRKIAARGGLPTDTSRDHEFTDWEAVRRVTEQLLAELGQAARA